jgi:hypothetical protein
MLIPIQLVFPAGEHHHEQDHQGSQAASQRAKQAHHSGMHTIKISSSISATKKGGISIMQF